jgi:Sugar (and other) transporter
MMVRITSAITQLIWAGSALKIEGPSLALGGEYGGAATYVTEHSGQTERGYTTSYIQTTARLGMFLALLVIGLSRYYTHAKSFAEWGWRVPSSFRLFCLSSRSTFGFGQ